MSGRVVQFHPWVGGTLEEDVTHTVALERLHLIHNPDLMRYSDEDDVLGSSDWWANDVPVSEATYEWLVGLLAEQALDGAILVSPESVKEADHDAR